MSNTNAVIYNPPLTVPTDAEMVVGDGPFPYMGEDGQLYHPTTEQAEADRSVACLLYTSPSPRD